MSKPKCINKSKPYDVSDQLSYALKSIDKFIEEIKGLQPSYKYLKTRHYIVYCPSCYTYHSVLYYSYKKALEGRLTCYCKTPMKPLDEAFKSEKIRRLEILKAFLSALNPIILNIFKDDLERWSKVMKSWWNREIVVDISTLNVARVTIHLEHHDYIDINECGIPEVFARFERIAAFHQTEKVVKFVNELEKLRQGIPFRAIVTVYKYELGVDRELLARNGFADAMRIEGFKCLPKELLVSMLVKVIQ